MNYNTINKNDLLTGYKNIRKIIDTLIKKNLISYGADENATNNYKEMRQFRDENGYFQVFSGGDHGHLGRHHNIKFRALHDYMHYTYNITFSFEDEKHLSDVTAHVFRNEAWNELNVTAWECYVIDKIVQAEIRGQIEYFEKHKEYVTDQSKFIEEYLNVS